MTDGADINDHMVAFTLERLRTMGEKEGGLYNYYRHLADRGTMLRREELVVAQYIADSCAGMTVLEICAGAAQLGHYLALLGHTVHANEIDKLRLAFARDLGAHLGSTCVLHAGRWQSLDLHRWRLVVTLNAATNMIEPADAAILRDYVLAGGEVIMRPRQFGARGIGVDIPGLKASKVHDDVYHYTAL